MNELKSIHNGEMSLSLPNVNHKNNIIQGYSDLIRVLDVQVDLIL